MSVVSLRKVGGSVMLAVPPAILDVLDLQPGAKVALAVENGLLVVGPCVKAKRRYTLKELLAQCHPKARRGKKEQEWVDSRPAGRELI